MRFPSQKPSDRASSKGTVTRNGFLGSTCRVFPTSRCEHTGLRRRRCFSRICSGSSLYHVTPRRDPSSCVTKKARFIKHGSPEICALGVQAPPWNTPELHPQAGGVGPDPAARREAGLDLCSVLLYDHAPFLLDSREGHKPESRICTLAHRHENADTWLCPGHGPPVARTSACPQRPRTRMTLFSVGFVWEGTVCVCVRCPLVRR